MDMVIKLKLRSAIAKPALALAPHDATTSNKPLRVTITFASVSLLVTEAAYNFMYREKRLRAEDTPEMREWKLGRVYEVDALLKQVSLSFRH